MAVTMPLLSVIIPSIDEISKEELVSKFYNWLILLYIQFES